MVKLLVVLLFILITSLVSAGEIPHVCHSELSSWIQAKQPLSIVDIQSAEEFRAHNYSNSLSAGNDPLRLKKIASQVRPAKGKVVIVSAAGGSDALQTIELLVRGGVKRSRILVLEGGMEAAAKNATCDCCKPSSLNGAVK